MAIADLSQSIQLDPNDPDIYNIRGSIYFIQKEYKLARTDLEKSKELYSAKGDLQKTAEIDNLLRQLTKLEQSAPASESNLQTADEYYDRAFEYHQKQEYDLALADYNQVIERNPDREKA